jgi:TRAP-type mannitol/chloroaromatic compound transport system substrate-binding protein
MALNAYKSDWSSYAQTAESANTATSAALATRALSADSAVTDDNDQTITSTYGKEITLVNGNTLKLVNSNGNAIGNGTLSIPFIIGNSVTAGVWTGVYDNISSYSDGLMILYKPN